MAIACAIDHMCVVGGLGEIMCEDEGEDGEDRKRWNHKDEQTVSHGE